MKTIFTTMALVCGIIVAVVFVMTIYALMKSASEWDEEIEKAFEKSINNDP